jgi:hypothetical protein
MLMFRLQLHLQHLCVAPIEFAEQISMLTLSSEFLALPRQLVALPSQRRSGARWQPGY